MSKSRFTVEQIIGILKKHQAGLSAADVCRGIGRDAYASGLERGKTTERRRNLY